MESGPDAFERGSGFRRRLFIVCKSNVTKTVVGTAMLLLPILELWREQICEREANLALFLLDLLCASSAAAFAFADSSFAGMVVVTLDAALTVYFKNVQSESWHACSYTLLYPLLWVTWTMQQLKIGRLAGAVIPLLWFVKNSELRLTVTIFIRFCFHTASISRAT